MQFRTCHAVAPEKRQLLTHVGQLRTLDKFGPCALQRKVNWWVLAFWVPSIFRARAHRKASDETRSQMCWRVCASIPFLKTVTNFALPRSDRFNARPFAEQDLSIGRSSPHTTFIWSLCWVTQGCRLWVPILGSKWPQRS